VRRDDFSRLWVLVDSSSFQVGSAQNRFFLLFRRRWLEQHLFPTSSLSGRDPSRSESRELALF